MQEQPSKYIQYPLEHSCLFWRMEWLLLSLQDQRLPGCLLLLWLGTPITRVTAKESLCNKSPSITHSTTLCRGVFISSPVPRVFLCFPICHVPPLPHKLSVGSEQDPHWQPGAGQPQLTANSLLLFVCQLSNWHQYGEHNCSICTCSTNKQQRQAPVFPVSGLCICLLHCLPLGIDMRFVGNLPGANGNRVH